jgi:hypothetical protein
VCKQALPSISFLYVYRKHLHEQRLPAKKQHRSLVQEIDDIEPDRMGHRLRTSLIRAGKIRITEYIEWALE